MHPLIETAKVIVEKGAKYLTLEGIVAKLKGWTQNIAVVDALGLASENRNVRTENTVFLGCLSALEAFPVDEKAIRESSLAVPKTIEQNLKAFDLVKRALTARFALLFNVDHCLNSQKAGLSLAVTLNNRKRYLVSLKQGGFVYELRVSKEFTPQHGKRPRHDAS